MMLKKGIFISCIFIIGVFEGFSQSVKSTFDFAAYYKAFSSEDTALFNQQLVELNPIESEFKPAFVGALLMKKSKSMATIREKLDMFKEGRNMLEGTISKDPENVEYRFLRLATQENAPGFLNYNDDKTEDANFIVSHFQSLDKVTQDFIIEYSRQSETLKTDDLKK